MGKLAEVRYEDYLRMNRMPTLWCAGCGDGTIMKSLIRAMDMLKLNKDDTCIVSGIGCSGRMSSYMDFNTLHTTHGRALAYATGMKLAAPKNNVIVVSGDGDCLAIGGNHFLHAARRNMDMTLIIVNNFTYGLTGGQVSPQSPLGSYTPTSPFDSIEPLLDTYKVALAAGATFIGRGVVSAPVQMDKVIKAAIAHKGFSVVEVLSNCHINWGRKNGHPDAHELVQWMKNDLSTFSKEEAEQSGKFLLGILHQSNDRPEYAERYYSTVVAAAKNKAAKKQEREAQKMSHNQMNDGGKA
jgi:2-oxoglutarate/2-oxoacid ferredoxin oxidoreductase subunit beta